MLGLQGGLMLRLQRGLVLGFRELMLDLQGELMLGLLEG